MSDQELPEPRLGEALSVIHAEGGMEAMALVADIVESNHRSLERSFESLHESEKAAHDRTKSRLDEALHGLAVIRSRINWLINPDILEPWDGHYG